MRLLLGAALVGAAGFSDVDHTNICSRPSPAGVFAVVERTDSADQLATVTVCLVEDATQPRIAGYRGELTLGRAARVVKIDRPAGGTRIENAAVPGRIAFAGVAAAGLASGPLLVITVAHYAASDDARLRLALFAITDVAGHEITARVRVDSLARTIPRQ